MFRINSLILFIQYYEHLYWHAHINYCQEELVVPFRAVFFKLYKKNVLYSIFTILHNLLNYFEKKSKTERSHFLYSPVKELCFTYSLSFFMHCHKFLKTWLMFSCIVRISFVISVLICYCEISLFFLSFLYYLFLKIICTYSTSIYKLLHTHLHEFFIFFYKYSSPLFF